MIRRLQQFVAGLLAVGLVASAAWTVIGFVREYRPIEAWHQPPVDRGVVGGRRLGELRPRLEDVPVVGYVAPEPAAHYQAEHFDHFVIAQYTLAPTLVLERTDLPLIVADFPDDQTVTRFADEHGLAIVRRGGRGVALLRRPVE